MYVQADSFTVTSTDIADGVKFEAVHTSGAFGMPGVRFFISSNM